MFSYFYGSFAFAAACLTAAFFIGFGINLQTAISCVISTAIIATMETTFSVDNSVLNARILRKMSRFWQKMFVTVGIMVAVFGMRIVMPIVIVMISSGKSFHEAFIIATTEPKHFEEILSDCHYLIMGFGFSFLGMVAIDYFTADDNEVQWLGFENFISKTPDILKPFLYVLVIGSSTVLSLHNLSLEQSTPFMISVASGVGLKLFLNLFDRYLGEDFALTVARYGIVGFLYLEVLDASFSFDGLTAAFAVAKDFWVITLGCAIGSMFVRSCTLYMVDHDTLGKLKYLEPAAFYSIAFLVLTMVASVNHIELSELVVGLGSSGIILAGVIHSLKEKNKSELVQV